LPPEIQEAHLFVEMEVRPTLWEWEELSERFIDTVFLYKAVRNAVEFGGDLKF
jgi:hypothetical protein